MKDLDAFVRDCARAAAFAIGGGLRVVRWPDQNLPAPSRPRRPMWREVSIPVHDFEKWSEEEVVNTPSQMAAVLISDLNFGGWPHEFFLPPSLPSLGQFLHDAKFAGASVRATLWYDGHGANAKLSLQVFGDPEEPGR